ncbi:aspartate aminotransferase family protein [Ostreibacterium oceani]|uniref:Aspartate aminotransferase family protein n=1 Tax=Ostreibacterium oceani TaxID=2654998 RepID=A0A6N7EYS4_9GAMM|nr:aspartate aminotransferase family protein [Ostreibacterium oceani]MPV86705.1 aspartate aminotransferase family protein [Ostreibacterium oceani]
MSHVFHRSLQQTYPVAVSGEGVYVIDNQGKRYIDACGGAAVSCLGYDYAPLKTAINAQIDKLPFVHSSFFTTDILEQAAEALVNDTNGVMSHVYFVSGGSEAIEAAIKMARQYFVDTGKPSKRYFIARKQSYHGNTLGALSLGGNEARKAPYKDILIGANHISACYEYREKQPDESAEAYGLRAANELEAEILRLGAENVAAFVAETVVGATAGCLPPAPTYFKRIREICDQYDVLLILDEVMCGMGRTGTLHAYTQDGITPDIQAVAKGIAAGYQPLGAVFMKAFIVDAIRQGAGFFQHGHTYICHATAVAAGLATQRIIKSENLLDNVVKQGDYLSQRLHEQLADKPYVGEIRGRGLFKGIELVADKASKTPHDASLPIASRIRAVAMDNGLMCYPIAGTIDGVNGNHVLLAPAYIIQAHEIDEIVDKLEKTITTVMDGIATK